MRPLTLLTMIAISLMLAGDAFAQGQRGKRGKRGAGQQQQGQQQGQQRRGQQQGQRPNLEKMFKSIDANGDGSISKDELPQQFQQRFQRMDTNGDGVFDAAEQAALIEKFSQNRGAGQGRGLRQGEGKQGSQRGGQRGQRSFDQLLQRMDKNGDGALSKDELPEKIQARFETLDANSDGIFDRAEQKAAMERMQSRGRMGEDGKRGSKGEKGQKGNRGSSPAEAKKGQRPKRPDGNG